jgi:hypothetical protein
VRQKLDELGWKAVGHTFTVAGNERAAVHETLAPVVTGHGR